MDSYTSFAQVYDTFMDNVPYDEWTEFIIQILKEYKIDDGLVLDLGCGTGKVTRRLGSKGFDMIGVDNSFEMLDIARKKSEGYEPPILYLNQDMREFELYGTVKAVVSVCDSMNYILEDEDLLQVFKLVNNYLDPKGLFIFDFNTKYKYETILGDNIIAENRDNCSFIWDNIYYEEEEINEYQLSIFIKEEGSLYRKFEETHYQRAYTEEEIIESLQISGFENIKVYGDFTFEKPKKDSERLFFVCRK